MNKLSYALNNIVINIIIKKKLKKNHDHQDVN